MIHDKKGNKHIDYASISTILLDISRKIKEMDLTVLNAIEQGSEEDDAYLGWDLKGFKDSNFLYIYGPVSEELYIKLKFKNNELCNIKLKRRDRYSDDTTAFQLLIGEKKILINGLWFDRIDFEAESFQKDTQNLYPFTLFGLCEALLSFGVKL